MGSKRASPAERARPDRLGRGLRVTGLVLVMVTPGGAAAQQTEPAAEIYATAAYYRFGNDGPLWWRPEFGLGFLAPLGRRWAVLCDLTASRAVGQRLWGFYPNFLGIADGRGDMSFHVSRLSVTPSLVRLWRRQRFSVYAGAGSGLERDWERTRLRIFAIEAEPGRLLYERSDERRGKNKPMLVNLRAGLIVGMGRRLVLRTGWRYARTYTDAPGSTAFEVGIGYRFRR